MQAHGNQIPRYILISSSIMGLLKPDSTVVLFLAGQGPNVGSCILRGTTCHRSILQSNFWDCLGWYTSVLDCSSVLDPFHLRELEFHKFAPFPIATSWWAIYIVLVIVGFICIEFFIFCSIVINRLKIWLKMCCSDFVANALASKFTAKKFAADDKETTNSSSTSFISLIRELICGWVYNGPPTPWMFDLDALCQKHKTKRCLSFSSVSRLSTMKLSQRSQ